MSAQALAGREHELVLLEERLMVAGDRGGALVVCGDAGMGKSALLQAARRSAVDHGLATLMTAGYQSEAHIAFAGLHRLLRPVLGSLDRLPGPQRAAIQAAFVSARRPRQTSSLSRWPRSTCCRRWRPPRRSCW